MLLSLHVKNLALIDETEITFGPNLNILTGETGAGKSLIIGSVSLALGAKAEKDLIRSGADYALVELVFQTNRPGILRKMEELDLYPEDDGIITISRRIQENRSICKVNGETVSARICKELAEELIDIHGQHEHQSLLNKRKHLDVLDAYCMEQLEPVLKQIGDAYQQFRQIQHQLEEGSMDEEARQKELALAEFEVQEIEQAQLVPGEEEELERRYRKMENARRIAESVGIAHQCLGYESEGAAGEQTGRALRELKSVAAFDEDLTEGVNMLTDIDGLLNDLNRFLSNYEEGLEFDEEEFVTCETRLNLLNHLRSRYGNTVQEILAYEQKQQEKIDRLKDFDAYRAKLQQEKEQVERKLLQACKKASALRQKSAKELSKQLTEALEDLNFQNVEFEVSVQPEESKVNSRGYDEVEFMISTNPGEPVKPLTQVASGGELSRIMLGLKTVFAGKDSVETLIFDEIDSGISGRTAWKVSQKMGKLARDHQIICITHLPQIAANADTHFLIEKSADGNSTRTRLFELSEEDSIRELARMLGGEELTDAVLENAREIRKQAKSS